MSVRSPSAIARPPAALEVNGLPPSAARDTPPPDKLGLAELDKLGSDKLGSDPNKLVEPEKGESNYFGSDPN